VPTYISLINWTDQGIRNIKDTLGRSERVAEDAEKKYGARFEQIYWTVGPYDIIAILEAPDKESATALLLEDASQGNIRTITLRAFDREEMRGNIERLGS
jgi:uncharacterized protein with GYD domain